VQPQLQLQNATTVSPIRLRELDVSYFMQSSVQPSQDIRPMPITSSYEMTPLLTWRIAYTKTWRPIVSGKSC